jgi:hypothetical protein
MTTSTPTTPDTAPDSTPVPRNRGRQRAARTLARTAGIPYTAALRRLTPTVETLGRYASQVWNTTGTRQRDPICDGPCNQPIRTRDGQHWTLVHAPGRQWANDTGIVCDACLPHL